MKARPLVEGDLSNANTLQQKHVAKAFITMWCQAIARNEGDDFEREWGLQGTVFETPTKKRRRAGEEGTAVADSIGTDDD